MRWISFFILAYVTLGLQTGISRAMQWHSAGPNLVLIAVVFIAMNAPHDVALLGSFLLGAMQDLTTLGTMGLYSLSYGLVAMFIGTARQAIHREHPLTHFTLTLAGGLITGAVLVVHGWVHPPRYPILVQFDIALYSAILALVLLGGLQRLKRIFRFQPARQRGYH